MIAFVAKLPCENSDWRVGHSILDYFSVSPIS